MRDNDLEKDPGERFESCEPLLAELELIQAEHTSAAPISD